MFYIFGEKLIYVYKSMYENIYIKNCLIEVNQVIPFLVVMDFFLSGEENS